MSSFTDINGRPWAKLSQLKAGDKIELDAGFTCTNAGSAILEKEGNRLFFKCRSGQHFIDGQADNDEHCIGIYAPTNDNVIDQKID